MKPPTCSRGRAVYTRTDTPDYAQETVVFKTLDELLARCLTADPNRALEKIILEGVADECPVAVTLDFLAVSHGASLSIPKNNTRRGRGSVED